MDLKRLYTDDKAVSPVVGVTMMIAIAVVLAAVVGALVLGLGQSQRATPQASFEFNTAGNSDVVALHDGGDSVSYANVQVKVSGTGSASSLPSTGEWTAGKSQTVATSTGSDTVVRIVWSAPDSEKTTVLAKYEVE